MKWSQRTLGMFSKAVEGHGQGWVASANKWFMPWVWRGGCGEEKPSICGHINLFYLLVSSNTQLCYKYSEKKWGTGRPRPICQTRAVVNTKPGQAWEKRLEGGLEWSTVGFLLGREKWGPDKLNQIRRKWPNGRAECLKSKGRCTAGETGCYWGIEDSRYRKVLFKDKKLYVILGMEGWCSVGLGKFNKQGLGFRWVGHKPSTISYNWWQERNDKSEKR